MKKILLVLAIVFVSSNGLWAQETRDNSTTLPEDLSLPETEEGVIKQRRHFAFGAKLQNDGYGGFFEIGRAKDLRKGLLFQIDISERKHTKEEKINLGPGANSPVIYGKINYFYPVKLGVQYSYLLGNKSNTNGVSVTANLGGGVSLGLLRPYMLTVQMPNGEIKNISYEEDSLRFTDGPILDGPGFGRGWGKMKVVPGFYVKPAFRFEYGRSNEMLTALEVGASFEYYTKDIEQMILQDPKSFFISGYVSIIFGRRK